VRPRHPGGSLGGESGSAADAQLRVLSSVIWVGFVIVVGIAIVTTGRLRNLANTLRMCRFPLREVRGLWRPRHADSLPVATILAPASRLAFAHVHDHRVVVNVRNFPGCSSWTAASESISIASSKVGSR
jgi:hypothetical protein